MFGTDDVRGIPSATNVDHFGVTVPDLQQAIEFFTEVLGADLIFTFDEGPGTKNPADLNAAFGVPQNSKLKIAMLRLGPTVNLELMQYESSEQRQVMPKNSDFDAPHIAFFVGDMDVAAEYLSDHGCKLFSGPLSSKEGPKAGQSIRYFQTPWGMFLEILTRPKHMPYEEQTAVRLFGPVAITKSQLTWKQNGSASEGRDCQLLNIGRTLVAFPFLMNGLGVVPQNLTAAALERAGFPKKSIPFLVQVGRAVQLAGAIGLVSGRLPKSASSALMTFLIGATIIGHPFWKATDEKSRTQDIAAMFGNLGLLGGLLYLAMERHKVPGSI